jgi:hypothetical protein
LRHADPPELSERLAHVLGAILRVVAALAVAEAEVELPVWPEGQLAALVLGSRLPEREKDACGLGQGDRAGAIRPVLDDPRVVRDRRVVDVEEPAPRVGRMEGERAIPARRRR